MANIRSQFSVDMEPNFLTQIAVYVSVIIFLDIINVCISRLCVNEITLHNVGNIYVGQEAV